MKHIAILVPRDAILGSLEGTRQLFTQINAFARARGATPFFQVELVGLQRETPAAGGIYTVRADRLLDEVTAADLIIIPAVDGDIGAAIDSNRAFLPWLTARYGDGAEVASLCMGAFLLASTGLLNGRQCATHWMAANTFRQMFPEVELVTERIITDCDGLYSSGGAFSYQQLILYLIEKYAGRELANLAAKVFAIDIDRRIQSPFTIFHGQKDHRDPAVLAAQEYIEAHFRERLTVDGLARRCHLGRRNFERRFKKATANTVLEYIQRVRVEAAKLSLESSRENVETVMDQVGYADPKTFRATFRKFTGLSPIQYRNKYYRELPA